MLGLEELERAVRVMAPRIVAHRVQAAVQPDDTRVVLTIWGPAPGGASHRQHVLLCCDPVTGRIALPARAPRAAERPPAFAQYLKAHALGARIERLALLGGDRLVALDLETGDGAARLLLSLFGRRSNLYWLDASGRLLAALRPLDATRPELSLGEVWVPPASGAPARGRDRFADASDAELFVAIEEVYAAREAEDAEATLRRTLEQALSREARRLDRKLEKLEQELAGARAAGELARQGELLKGALTSVGRGDTECRVTDPESGEEVRITLDPSKSPAGNLEAIFKRYQKAVRRLTKGGAQEDAVRAARRAHAELEAGFSSAREDAAALREFAAREAVKALLRRSVVSTPARGAARASGDLKLGKLTVPRRLAPRRYPTADSLEIWVGRSDAGNDHLTTRLARGKDLFFHLDGAPGSHVILRTGGRSDPPSEALLDACELAVHYSKSKNASRADVHVVPIANVRKPKGAKPGLVHVHGGRTIHLRRTPARLQRLLASRLPDA